MRDFEFAATSQRRSDGEGATNVINLSRRKPLLSATGTLPAARRNGICLLCLIRRSVSITFPPVWNYISRLIVKNRHSATTYSVKQLDTARRRYFLC